MMPAHSLPALHKNRQRGMASIEFALIAMFMVVLLMGLFVYWRAFQAQQSLTRATGDGARMVLSLINTGTRYPCAPHANAANNQSFITDRLTEVVKQSLKQSGMPGAVDSDLTVKNFALNCTQGTNHGSVSFTVEYQLPSLLGNSTILSTEPKLLFENSTVHFQHLL